MSNADFRPVPRIHPDEVTDREPAAPGFRGRACLHDFAGFGSCIRTKGHTGPHRDANGYGWELVATELELEDDADDDEVIELEVELIDGEPFGHSAEFLISALVAGADRMGTDLAKALDLTAEEVAALRWYATDID